MLTADTQVKGTQPVAKDDPTLIVSIVGLVLTALATLTPYTPTEIRNLLLGLLLILAVIFILVLMWLFVKPQLRRWREYRNNAKTRRVVDNNVSTLCQLAEEFRHIIDPDKSDTISYAIVAMASRSPLSGKVPAYSWPFFSTSMETILYFARKGMPYSDFKQLVVFLKSCDRDFNDRIQESAKIIKNLGSKGFQALPEYHEHYRTARISYIGFIQRLVTFRNKVHADLGLKADDQSSLLALPNLYHDPPIEL